MQWLGHWPTTPKDCGLNPQSRKHTWVADSFPALVSQGIWGGNQSKCPWKSWRAKLTKRPAFADVSPPPRFRDIQRKSVLLSWQLHEDEERRYKEVPKFCVNSPVDAEKAWLSSLYLSWEQGLNCHLNHFPKWGSQMIGIKGRDAFWVEEWKGNLC